MRFSVDAWDPSYGTSEGANGDAHEPTVEVDVDVEHAASTWRPLDPRPGTALPATVWFVDGVRRVDARLWIDDGGGRASPAIAASYAAGVVRCNGTAELVHATTARIVVGTSPILAPIVTSCGTFSCRHAAAPTPEALSIGLQAAMTDAEILAAEAARSADGGSAGEPGLLVVDGPLRGRQHLPGTVGVIKSHHVEYLPPSVQNVLALLVAGQRTPLFVIGGRFPRLSWYVRLPGPHSGPRACLVRCEMAPDGTCADAVGLADATTALLPRFASAPHKDSRAPQNLVPIAGLERQLRRRLGDPALVLRALRTAARRAEPSRDCRAVARASD